MDANDQRRHLNRLMGEACGPPAARAADLLGVEPDDPVLFELSTRAFWAGVKAAGDELEAQAIEQDHPAVFSIDTSLPDDLRLLSD